MFVYAYYQWRRNAVFFFSRDSLLCGDGSSDDRFVNIIGIIRINTINIYILI